MKSQKLGKNISGVEIQNISTHGIWLYVTGKEYFMPYEEYPWFKQAKVCEIYNLELLPGGHLHWPDLDVDLEVESLEHPEKYPLIYK
jgi:hypothetical protein